MLYLFWAILNIAIFFIFGITCVRATKLIREKFGLFSAIFFVVGLLCLMVRNSDENDNKEPGTSMLRTWKFVPADDVVKNTSAYIDVMLDKNILSTYELGIEYGNTLDGRTSIPFSANSWTTGITSGTKWKPSSIMVNRTPDNTGFEYHVRGAVEWKLLGLTLYSQPKTYNGIAPVK